MHRRGRDSFRSDGHRTRPVGGSDLGARLRSLEGAPYPAYKDIRGSYPVGEATLEIQRVQPDPFAPPSRLRVTVPLAATAIAEEAAGPTARLAAEDFFARRIEGWLHEHRDAGSVVRIDPAVQQVLRRTALSIYADHLELLLTAALPARGRRIEGHRAARALADGIPQLLQETVVRGAWDRSALTRHRECLEDHVALTAMLPERGWVAFLADGSRLARRSGEEDTPLEEGNVPFLAPAELAAEIELPHAGRIRGTGIPRGITLLCGGGFHGKSTLLRALAVGVYPHIPGDGRERVAVDPTAMAIRAEDGRAITDIDLRPFLRSLPSGHDVASFSTTNASGSTSQAAAILEAISAGCRCLLIDEDTSATNFLLRDPWMARLLRDEQEPIVPLISRLREIHQRFGVSTILVVGGSGEAFRVADHVIVMDAYHASDASERVAEIRREMGPGTPAPEVAWSGPERTLPLDRLRRRDPKVRALGAGKLLVAKSEIDLGASGALVHPSQGRTLAAVLSASLENREAGARLPGMADRAARQIRDRGPGAVSPYPRGDLAEVRAQEIAMLYDRLRYPDGEDPGPRRGTGGDLGG